MISIRKPGVVHREIPGLVLGRVKGWTFWELYRGNFGEFIERTPGIIHWVIFRWFYGGIPNNIDRLIS